MVNVTIANLIFISIKKHLKKVLKIEVKSISIRSNKAQFA